MAACASLRGFVFGVLSVVLVLVSAGGVWAQDAEAEDLAAKFRWDGGALSTESGVRFDGVGRVTESSSRTSLSMDIVWSDDVRVTSMYSFVLERVVVDGGREVNIDEAAGFQFAMPRQLSSMRLERSRSGTHTPLPELPAGTRRIERLEGYVDVIVGVGEPQVFMVTVEDAESKRVIEVGGETGFRIETDFDTAGNTVYLRYSEGHEELFGGVLAVDERGEGASSGGGSSWGGNDAKVERRVRLRENAVGVEIKIYREVKRVRVPLELRGLALPGHVEFAA